MNPLNFKEFVQNKSKDEKLYKFLKKLMTPPIKSYPKLVFLGQGKNGIVYKIDEDTTIKIFNNINIDCPRNNKYAKFCTFFYNEVMIGMLLTNLVVENICYNFPIIKNAMILDDIGVITRDFSDYVFSNFLKETFDNQIINNLILQYFMAIAIIHAKYQSNILDNTLANIYVKKTNKKKLVYRIENKTYEINCYGYLIIIGDFGSNKFNYPQGDYFVQLVKYINKFKYSPKQNKYATKIDNVRNELYRQVYFEGLFNPYVEHVFFCIHLEKFCKDYNRNFNILDEYKKITKFDRNGRTLLRKNLTMIQLVDILFSKYL
jgi:hypothetical protein